MHAMRTRHNSAAKDSGIRMDHLRTPLQGNIAVINLATTPLIRHLRPSNTRLVSKGVGPSLCGNRPGKGSRIHHKDVIFVIGCLETNLRLALRQQTPCRESCNVHLMFIVALCSRNEPSCFAQPLCLSSPARLIVDHELAALPP